MVFNTQMHFKGYLQLIHKIKQLKEGFVWFKYFTDPKKQMKDCTNTKYLDLNSNTHRHAKAASCLQTWRTEGLPSHLSCSLLPFTALRTLETGLRRNGVANTHFSVPSVVPSRVRDGGCMSRLWWFVTTRRSSQQEVNRQCFKFYIFEVPEQYTKPINPYKTHPSKSKQASKYITF